MRKGFIRNPFYTIPKKDLEFVANIWTLFMVSHNPYFVFSVLWKINMLNPKDTKWLAQRYLNYDKKIITLFSRLIDANKSLEKDLRQMKTTPKILKHVLLMLKQIHRPWRNQIFIADLMAPLLDKIMGKIQEKSIDWYCTEKEPCDTKPFLC